MYASTAAGAPTRLRNGFVTTRMRSRPAYRTRTSSPARTGCAGLARSPFTRTWPARQAEAAIERVFMIRTDQIQTSARTLPSAPPMSTTLTGAAPVRPRGTAPSSRHIWDAVRPLTLWSPLLTAVPRPQAARHLYLARHSEATADESALTDRGRRQADELGRRLRSVPLQAIHHGPLPRAAQTARLVGQQLAHVPLHVNELADDYVPYVPEAAELPDEAAEFLKGFVDQLEPGTWEHGPQLAQRALAEFTGPVDGEEPRHELVVTHAFVVSWLVSNALYAPPWRWLGLNAANAALTVIRYPPGQPASVLCYNDVSHLPTELRWTGFSAEIQP